MCRRTIIRFLSFKVCLLFVMPLLALFPANCNAEESIDTVKKGELIYNCDMESEKDLDGWKVEGPGKLAFTDGWMHMFSPEEKWHHVLWCPRDFPDSFIAEWQVHNLKTDAGLCIIFFAAKGVNGEDIFDPDLPERDGTFSQYTKGKINCYHISYYANNPKNPDRGDSHLRKNKSFSLVQTGSEGIPTKSENVHGLTLIKNGPHIMMYVDDRKIIDWIDDGKEYGPVLTGGKIGFRQMQWTHFRYCNFRVWAIDNNR